MIAKYESHKNRTWKETLRVLSDTDKNCLMPPPALFLAHTSNVNAAVAGEKTLYDGHHQPISLQETLDLQQRLRGHNGGAWTRLDAMFIEGAGFMKLDIETDHCINDEIIGTRNPLELCVETPVCYVDPLFNNQGLPTRRSTPQEYRRDENVYYIAPKKGRAARYNAYEKAVILDCDASVNFSDKALGVFACHRGSQ